MMFDYLFPKKPTTGHQNSAAQAKRRLLELKLSNTDNHKIDVTALSKELMNTLSRYYPHINPEDVNIEFSNGDGYSIVAATVPDQPNKQKS